MNIYILAGLMGGFLVVLFSILAMDFDGIEAFKIYIHIR